MASRPQSVVAYVDSLPIHGGLEGVELGAGLEGARAQPTYVENSQAFVVGSQIAEFASTVGADLRPGISHSLLLAQLAADKAIEGGERLRTGTGSTLKC